MNIKIGALIVGIILIGVFSYIVMDNKEQELSTPTISESSTEKIKVVTSFYPLYFFAKEIGKEKADVQNITPAGVEPHEYEPLSKDLVAIENSKLLIVNGEGFEPWGTDLLNTIDTEAVTVVSAGEGLATLMSTAEEHEGEEAAEYEIGERVVDPHVWLSPVLVQKMTERIRDGFIAADPQNERYYKENADALATRLTELDIAFQTGLQSCERKEIITSHAAFGYLAKAYDLIQIPISGLSTEEEPSSQQLAEVAQFAKNNDVKYIFFETLVPSEFSETIATEVGAKTLVLNPIEGLTTEEIAEGKSYFTEMQANLSNLRIALQCS